MPLVVRLLLGFLALLAIFWGLAIVVGWLWYIVVGVGAVALITLLVWLFTREKTAPTSAPPVTKKLEKRAEKELQKLEQRQRNGPQ